MTTLRPYQDRAVADLRSAVSGGARAPCLVLPTGGGKCLGIGTPVMKHDGSVVSVEDVRVGDALMGPDSGSRRVLSVTRGRGPLFRIVPTRGAPWVCNDAHILTLVHTETGRVVDVPLADYLGSSRWFRHLHKQFSVGVEFPPSGDLPLDPYFVGLWLGDGKKDPGCVKVTTMDAEITAYLKEFAARWGAHLTMSNSGGTRCPTYHLVTKRGQPNPLLTTLRAVVGPELRVPSNYLTACRRDRLQLLAGLVDSDGHLHNGGFEIAQVRTDYADAICFLARSLGFRALRSPKVVKGVTYHRIMIAGDASVIPTILPRKKAPVRKQIKDATRTGFSVEPIGLGEYAGFEIDGDGRFLLGDCTVTHNTAIATAIIRSAILRGGRVLFLAHRTELIGQAAGRLRAEGCETRVIQAGTTVGDPDCPVTVASIPTLARRDPARLPPASLVIFDEAHHTRATSWQRLAQHYRSALLLGLTATPERSDGAPLGDVFDRLVVGSTVRELTELGYLVPCEVFAPPAKARQLASDPVDAYREFGGGRKAVVFCPTVIAARDAATRFIAAGVPAGFVDGEISARERAETLRRFSAGELRVVTNCLCLTEGWDAPTVAVCILARGCAHPSLYLQIVGRVLRPGQGKDRAALVDLRGVVHVHGLPDDEREYSLEGKAISQSAKLPPLQTCKDCGAVFRPAPSCPVCGVVRPMPELPEVRKQRLEQVSASHTADQREAYRQRLVEIAQERNYRPEWVFYRMRARYGAGAA